MLKAFFTFCVFILFPLSLLSQPTNDDCANATTLTVNANCTSGTIDDGTTQSGEYLSPSCMSNSSGFNQTAWYKFVATSSKMYVQLYATGFSGNGATWAPSYWCSVVYSGGTCFPSSSDIVSCQNSNSQGSGDQIIINNMSGLTTGQTYLVQIGYRTGQGVNLVPNYCIKVGDLFTTACNICSSPCGAACGFTFSPSIAQVTGSCPQFLQYPYQEGNVTDTQCYSFTASNSNVSFQVIVNSTCPSNNNVSSFNWWLYNNSCGAAIQQGDLTSLQFTGLTVGQQYTYCFSFTVPAGCYHTTYWPYFVGAFALPVELLSFTGKPHENQVVLHWSTASEINNDYFSLERSEDGTIFNEVARIRGAGNSSTGREYEFVDAFPKISLSYYRLQQTDFDGTVRTYPPIAVVLFSRDLLSLDVNPRNELVVLNYVADETKMIRVNLYDCMGRLLYNREQMILQGTNSILLSTSAFSSGIYHLTVSDYRTAEYMSFMK